MAQTKARYFKHLLDSLGVMSTARHKVDKEKLNKENLIWLMNKTAQMFDYKGLPATMNRTQIEHLLQITGTATVWRVPQKYRPNGYGVSFNIDELTDKATPCDLFAFITSFAEAPDPYGEPYQVVITNPGFTPSISETLEINKDVVILRNDTNCDGLYRLHRKYARLLTEAEISLQSTLVLLRDQMTFICKTPNQVAAVDQYIEAREAGEYAAILAPDLGSPLEAVAREGRSNAVELAVNGVQAIRAMWYNELGLNPSFSLKREYTSAQEIDSNTDLLMPIIDDMFNQRKIGVANINALFGTSISVERSSAWKIKEQEIEYALEAEKNEAMVTPCDQGGDEVGDSGDFESAADDSGGSDS